MDKKDIREKMEKGWIRINVMFEILGSPKDYVEKAIKGYITKLKLNKDRVLMINEQLEPALEREGGLWSTIAECEMIVKNLEVINWLCINFMPASIEIIEPGKFSFEAREMMNWFNDTIAKLHEVSISARQTSSANQLMLRNINALLRNAVLLALEKGPADSKEISKKIGVDAKELEPLFDAMIKEKKIMKQGDKYSRA